MAKKTYGKQPGGSRATPKGSKDAITDLDLGNGLILKSDTVYTDQSPEYIALLGRRNSTYAAGGGTQVEFEANRNAIIVTTVTRRELTQNGATQYSPDYEAQSVLIGSFNNGKGGHLKSGVVNEATEWSHTPAREGSTSQMSSAETESIITYRNPSRFTEADIRNSTSALFYAFAGGNPVFWYDSQVSPEQNSYYDYKEGFSSLPSSGYLKEGWWKNPFASNLI